MTSPRITKIEVKDFRAFQGEPYVFDLKDDGQNLLLFGENGSGKSSLFQALQRFLEASQNATVKFSDYKNIFATASDGFVKIEIDRGKTYEWSYSASPYSNALIADAAKTSGFMDYKALLETYFLQREQPSVNVFRHLVNGVAAHAIAPGQRVTFGELWLRINREFRGQLSAARKKRIAGLLTAFNASWVVYLAELERATNHILSRFDHGTEIRLAPQALALVTRQGKPRVIEGAEVLLSVTYYGSALRSHHTFLNEARLSAIAVSLYLGSLQLNPASALRILVLDDVLIGLDMANRMPVIDILRQEFNDWQIILATYSKDWFEIIRERVEGDTQKWARCELYCNRVGSCDKPVLKAAPKDNLTMAKSYVADHDVKGGVIYARTAFEDALKHFCARKGLKIKFTFNLRELKSEDFWQATKQKLQSLDGREINTLLTDPKVKAQLHPIFYSILAAPTAILTDNDLKQAVNLLAKDVETYRRLVLNPVSHSSGTYPHESEVYAAIRTVEHLDALLTAIPK